MTTFSVYTLDFGVPTFFTDLEAVALSWDDAVAKAEALRKEYPSDPIGPIMVNDQTGENFKFNKQGVFGAADQVYVQAKAQLPLL
ncbi:MAG: hypothetical protein WAX89_07875 [Alphaproteobacteria bacterium]